jgi:hypothetical protein
MKRNPSIKTPMIAGIVFFAAALAIASSNVNGITLAEAEIVDYTLSFTNSANVFAPSNTTQQVTTMRDNFIDFSYSGYTAVSGGWGTLASGGYVLNATALSGLKSVSVAYGARSGSLTVSYGWAGANNYRVKDGSLTSSATTYTFQSEAPSYLKISNSSGSPIDIASLTLVYSCQASDDPAGLTYTLVNGTYSITGGTNASGSIVLPSTYKGIAVTSIGGNAFINDSNLSSVTIASSVTSIGGYAFKNCSTLSNLTFGSPSSLQTIGDVCFFNTALKTVIIPASVTTMGKSAFQSSQVTGGSTVFCEATSQPTGWAAGWHDTTFVPFWYSDVQPSSGNYWHYVNSVPTKW